MLAAGLTQSAAAQLPVDSLRLVVGFGVEEDASPEREILALWKHYLTESSDSSAARHCPGLRPPEEPRRISVVRLTSTLGDATLFAHA